MRPASASSAICAKLEPACSTCTWGRVPLCEVFTQGNSSPISTEDCLNVRSNQTGRRHVSASCASMFVTRLWATHFPCLGIFLYMISRLQAQLPQKRRLALKRENIHYSKHPGIGRAWHSAPEDSSVSMPPSSKATTLSTPTYTKRNCKDKDSRSHSDVGTPGPRVFRPA